jgi:hypothetical protein
LKFFKLVQDGKFTLDNIAFELFLDIVEWFDKDESHTSKVVSDAKPDAWRGVLDTTCDKVCQ